MFPSASREASRIGQIAVLPDRSNLGRRVHLKDLLGNRQLRDSMRHEVLVRVAFRSNVRLCDRVLPPGERLPLLSLFAHNR